MSLQIGQREREGMVILDLNGSLILGQQDSDLQQRLTLLRHQGKTVIALNLQHVSKIDSTGLGTLVVNFTELRKAGGRLALFNLHPSHLDLLLLTKLLTVFDVFTDEQCAVGSCFPDRATESYDVLDFVNNLSFAVSPITN